MATQHYSRLPWQLRLLIGLAVTPAQWRAGKTWLWTFPRLSLPPLSLQSHSSSVCTCSQTHSFCLSVWSCVFFKNMSLLKIIFKLFVFASLTAVVVLLLQHWLTTKQYVFNKDDIAKLAKQYAGECHTSLEGEAFKHIYCQTLCSQDRTRSRPSPKWWWSSEKGDDFCRWLSLPSPAVNTISLQT